MSSGSRLPNGKIVREDEKEDNYTKFTPIHPFEMRACGFSQLPRLPDVSDDSKIVKVDWAKSAPKWLQAVHGLNLEGRCKTKSCIANNKPRVIFQYGFRNDGVFDYFRNEGQVTCPMCHGYMNTENFGFASTWYKAEGHKRRDNTVPFTEVNMPWKYAPADHYTTFKNEIGDLVDWGRLVIRIQQHRPAGA